MIPDEVWEIPKIPAEVWEELRQMQRMLNEITGAQLDIYRMEREWIMRRARKIMQGAGA